MDIFDVMYERNIVSPETGYIHQDYDQYVEDITVQIIKTNIVDRR
jgi:hypothetical protein